MVSGDELRAAMRRFPSGIGVLTLQRPFGVTVGSLVSLSLEPALVGVAIGKDTQAHELVRDEMGFALSLLAADQEPLAKHFARSMPPIALWEGIATRDGNRGPLLVDALAWLECAVRSEHDAGDHTFFVGEVEQIALGRERPALVYVRGGYAAA
ncbi:MAG TPA: flavin reductase family protein [Gaiellaceae bacterium]|jgi:flavin reductase (DIM6/NTAB) family NADH-FMN oxidoreductase RutF|nr:flavin reductase family protein [Gaiellaceae bacterium]